MKKGMFVFTSIFLIAFLIFLCSYINVGDSVFQTLAITFGITFYHFFMRLVVGYTINFFFKNNMNYRRKWLQETRFEKWLFSKVNLRLLIKHIPTFDKRAFVMESKGLEGVIMATCQAEIVHEVIMVLSLLPIFLCIFYEPVLVFILTSIGAMILDSFFVIVQRYQRPRLMKLLNRMQKDN